MKRFILPTALVLVVASSCAQTRPTRVIDAHTHTEFTGQHEKTSGILMTRERYFEELRAIGGVGAVAHTSKNGGDYHDLRAQNVIHCAGINAQVDIARVEAGLKSGKYGCIKVYLGYVHQFASHEAYRPAYRLAAKYDVPVVFHTGDTYDIAGKLKYSDPLTIDEVAVDFPNVNFVIAHVGNPWIQSAAEVAYKNPNVYLEGSALLIGNLDEMPKDKVDEYVTRPLAWAFGYLENPAKLMYGTDWPLTDMASYLHAFQRAIPPEHWDAVFYENAARVFKFDKYRQDRKKAAK